MHAGKSSCRDVPRQLHAVVGSPVAVPPVVIRQFIEVVDQPHVACHLPGQRTRIGHHNEHLATWGEQGAHLAQQGAGVDHVLENVAQENMLVRRRGFELFEQRLNEDRVRNAVRSGFLKKDGGSVHHREALEMRCQQLGHVAEVTAKLQRMAVRGEMGRECPHGHGPDGSILGAVSRGVGCRQALQERLFIHDGFPPAMGGVGAARNPAP